MGKGATTSAAVSRDALTVTTADDVTLTVHRVRPATAPRAAVVLCHGLSSNNYAFDLPQRSLAGYLAGQGFDCFLPNLRGAADSHTDAASFGLDEYVEQDLPAILSLVQSASPSETIHWIGHSMGGILFLMYGAEQPDVPVARAITVGSALDYRAGRSIFQALLHARPLLPDRLNIPFGALSRAAALTSRVGVPLMPEAMNFARPNIEAELRQDILRQGFGPVPMRLLDDLATLLGPDGLARGGGTRPLSPHWPRYRVPTLLVGGTADRQCGVPAVEATSRILAATPELRVATFGREHGQRHDYGHFDLMVGAHAPTEVWPHLSSWLDTP